MSHVCCINNCSDVNTCVNAELITIAGGLTPATLVNFCEAVVKCVDAQFELISQGLENDLPNFIPSIEYYLRSLPGYTDEGDIFLSLSDDSLGWLAVEGSDVVSYTNEMAQDAVGTILADTSSVVFSYNDGLPSISAVVPPAFVRGQVSAGTGLSYNSTTGVFTNTGTLYTDEQAQDAIGSILGSEFTYNDSTPSIVLNVSSGLSKASPIRLGQVVGTGGNPAVLTANTEIPLADYILTFNNKTGAGSDQASITISTSNSSGSNEALFSFIATNKATIKKSVNNIAGNMETQYYGSGAVYLGASGYSLSGVGGHFYLSDMRGGTTHTTVEVGGVASQTWVTNGDTQIGLTGTKNTGFGGVTSPTANVDIAASTTTNVPLRIEAGVDPSSNYLNGSIWHANDHLYARLNGITKQLDNDVNLVASDFIQNNFSSAQAAANYWIDGHGRIDDYLQISTVGRLANDGIGNLSVKNPTGTPIGGDFRARVYRFWDVTGSDPSATTSYIYSSQGNFLNLHADLNLVIEAPVIALTQSTIIDTGATYPLTVMGYVGDVGNFDYLKLRNHNTAGDSKSVKTKLVYSANRTTSGETIFGKIGSEVIDYSDGSYKGDLVFETVSASVNSGTATEYMRLKYDGRLYVNSLDTDGSAPTTTGTTKMVVSDSTGLLSFIDVPASGLPAVPMSILQAATAANDIDSGNFKQTWRWNSLSGSNIGLSLNANTTGTGSNALFGVFMSGVNGSTSASNSAAIFFINKTGAGFSNNFAVSATAGGASNINTALTGTASGTGSSNNYGGEVSASGGNQAIGFRINASGASVNNYGIWIETGDFRIDTLIAEPSATQLVSYDGNILNYVTIGTGLSVDGSGVLSATTAGSQTFQSTLTIGSTLTGNNTIIGGGFDLAWNNIDDYTIEATGDTFLKVANYGSASSGDTLILVNSVTGEIGWAAPGGGGGGLTSFASGNLSGFFTTNVATATSTPSQTFAIVNAPVHSYWGNNTGSVAAPAYQSNAAFVRVNDTNVTATLTGAPTTALLETMTLTLGWSGTLSAARGGTGLGSLGTANQLIRVNAGATALEYFTPTFLTTALTTLNTLTAATQTFAVGTAGTDFAISSSGSVHTFNIPSASATARGVVTTGAQIFEGVKTFNVGGVINETGADSDFRIETTGSTTAVFADASTNRIGIFTAAPAYPLDITGNTRILGSLGIGTVPSTPGLSIGGSSFIDIALSITATVSGTAGAASSLLNITGTLIEAGSGVHPILSAVNLAAPTITGGLATVTNAATLYVAAAPTATVTGGNFSILVAAGASRFNGDVVIGTGTTYSTGGYLNVVRNVTSGRLEVVEPDVVSLNAQSGTAYTLALTDKGGMVRMSNVATNTVTVPPNSSVAFSIGTQILVYREGAGQTTIAAGVGVTINTADGALNLRVQHSVATLIKVATNTWVLSGDIIV